MGKSQYRDKRWHAFRAAIGRFYEFRCLECEKGGGRGAVLQVHHKHYDPKRAIWDYEPHEVELLCRGCHAQKHGKIMPQSGWLCVGDNDLGDLIGECEYCGNDLRYEFFIEHDNWEPLTVGTNCCDKLTGNKIASERRRYFDRLAEFVADKNWHKTKNKQIRVFGKSVIEIEAKEHHYIVKIDELRGLFPTRSGVFYIKKYIYKKFLRRR